MNRESLSIGLACFLGAFIGATLGLEFLGAASFIVRLIAAPVCMAFGGLIGYIVIDFDEFWSGALDAYEKTVNWTPYRPYWRVAFLTGTTAGVLWATFTIWVFLLEWYQGLGTPEAEKLPSIGYMINVGVIGFAVCWLLFFGIFAAGNRRKGRSDDQYLAILDEDTKVSCWLLLVLNPVCAPFVFAFGVLCVVGGIAGWLFFGAWRALCWVVKTAPVAWAASRGFAVQLFINVHSQRRLICLVDAAIGCGIGLYYGSGLVGAAAGCVLGVINYELVSIRWLKLKPA